MNNICEIFILSLLTKKRKQIVDSNKKLFPKIKIFKSINGYSKEEVIKELTKLNIEFHSLNAYLLEDGTIKNFNTYGTLANFLTKVKIMEYQINNNIPYICFIEDDLQLNKFFIRFINDKLLLLNENINIIRLDKWGEGYITSLRGSKNIIKLIRQKGIIQNIDNQLRENCGNELRVYNTPWKLLINSNEGDCLNTALLEKNFKSILNNYKNLFNK